MGENACYISLRRKKGHQMCHKIAKKKKKGPEKSLTIQCSGLCALIALGPGLILLGELRPRKPCSAAKKKKKVQQDVTSSQSLP